MDRSLRALPWLFGALLLAGLAFLGRDTRAHVNCEFTTDDGSEILPGISSGLAFHGKARLPTDGEDLDLAWLSGALQWSNGSEQMSVAASGSLFTGAKGEVLGLHLHTNEPPREFLSFSIATLNEDGWLDENRNRAFVSRNPHEKQMYPTNYECKVDG